MAAAEREAEERYAEVIKEIRDGSRRFASRARGQAEVVLDEMIDPEGEAIATLADVEGDAGALALAMPLELITFETWLSGQIGDQDELDLEIASHRDMWFAFGAWIGETLRLRHGGHWLFIGDDPKAWRLGFSKILLEVVPHAFAEQLLRLGAGSGKKLVGEIERIRVSHLAQRERDGGKEIDRFTPQHYIRMHTMPLGQWMVMDFQRLDTLWNKSPVAKMIEAVRGARERLGEQNGAIIERICEALAKADQTKALGEQTADRGLFEAIAQIVGLRRTTAPIAMDLLESMVMPALHIGVPKEFPPLDDEDISRLHKGIELFALFVDIVPHQFQAWDDGFLGTIPTEDLATPYRDKTQLEIGKGDWVIVSPARFREMLQGYDPDKLLGRYDEFVSYVNADSKAPRRRDDGRLLAETVARSLADFRASVMAASEAGSALVFRLLPPPA